MKKLFLLFLLTILVLLHPKTALAQQATPTATPVIKYDLAYPGILPDSPIYKLKVLRDKIEEALINDPKAKVEFYLLQTDKGILATAILVDKNEIDLAQTTALKTEDNYTKLTLQLGKINNKTNMDLYQKLKIAAMKHQEILATLVKRAPQSKKSIFQLVLDFSKTNLASVESWHIKK